MLTASYLYAGYSDYFGGYSCADNDEHSEHLLYAFYGNQTTLRDIVDQLVEDSYSGPSSEELPDEVTDYDVRKALLEMLSETGRKDYKSGALAECAANMERLTECPGCGTKLDGDEDCSECGEWFSPCESPVFIVSLTYWKREPA